MDPASLVQYGALGVLTITASGVAATLWRRLSTLQDSHALKLEELGAERTKQIRELSEVHAQRLEALADDHKIEMRALLERLIESHSTQMREYHGLAENLSNVLDSMTRKFERSTSPGRGRTGG